MQKFQIEITPDMIRQAELVFGDWKTENYDVLVELGGLGDVADLIQRFLALAACEVKTSSLIPS